MTDKPTDDADAPEVVRIPSSMDKDPKCQECKLPFDNEIMCTQNECPQAESVKVCDCCGQKIKRKP